MSTASTRGGVEISLIRGGFRLGNLGGGYNNTNWRLNKKFIIPGGLRAGLSSARLRCRLVGSGHGKTGRERAVDLFFAAAPP